MLAFIRTRRWPVATGMIALAVAATAAVIELPARAAATVQSTAVADSAPEPHTAPVATTSGPVVGVRRGSLDWFLGIPYAAPPTADLRWRPPVAPPAWQAPRMAAKFAPWCMQVAPAGFSRPILNEDCLYLNVVRPHSAGLSGVKRPVIVWIHGGGLRQGRADDYDPSSLVGRGDVVFVSFNYRLNIMGFLTHPALDGEGHAFANYGLMDQQFALAWVRRNVAAFGGDPANITLFGESSGGANVVNHLVSPRSAGLFHKAIIDSGSLGFGEFAPFYNGLALKDAEQVGIVVSAAAGCTGIEAAACLRRAPLERLASAVKTVPTWSFGVVVDGAVMPSPTRDMVLAGDFRRVPIINGANQDEWTWVEGLGEAARGQPLQEGEMAEHLRDVLGTKAGHAAANYPSSAYGGLTGLASAKAVTDALFVCPLLSLNTALARRTTVWGFRFADRGAPNSFPAVSFPYGAAHTLELQYLFKDYRGATGKVMPLSHDQQRLSDTMIDYWTTFARTGDPNSRRTRDWPSLGKRRSLYINLSTPVPRLVPVNAIADEHQCEKTWKY